MTVTVAEQTYVFLYCVLSGVIVGISFDVFRIIRRILHSSDISTFVQDIIFWVLSTAIVFMFMLKFNSGEVRWYMFLGTFLGAFMYFVSISHFIIAAFVWIIEFLKKVIAAVFLVITAPLKFILKIIKKPFILVFNISRRSFKQIKYKFFRNFTFFSKIIKKI